MKIIGYLLLLCILYTPAYPAKLKGRVTDYSACRLEKGENLEKVMAVGNYSLKKAGGFGEVIGWFEYDVTVDDPGWYELLIDYNPLVSNVGWVLHLTEYTVDGRHLSDYPYSIAVGRKKAGNIWLDKGLHKFRFENTNWFTQSPVTGWEFRPVATNLAQNVRIGLDPVNDYYGGSYYAVGESVPVHIYTGGKASGIFSLEVVRKSNQTVAQAYRVFVSPSETEVKQTISLSVKEEGSFFCRYKADGKEIGQQEALRKIEFSTIDTRPVAQPESGNEASKELIHTIDCLAEQPDYERVASRVVTGAAGTYRETGKADWDYFAYRLPALLKDELYFVEADIPDDAQRGIQIQFRERDPVNYIIGPGLETGIPYRNSNKMITQSYLYWPRFPAEQARIAVVNVGRNEHTAPAAVKQIRIYRLKGPLPSLKKTKNGREFANWFEEPLRWLDPYGARDKSREEMIRSAENMARTMRYAGATTMFLAADVYGMGMYPSQYRYSSRYSGDPLKLMLLVAQKYGLKVIADISPKQGALTTKYYNETGPERYQLFLQDKNGNHYRYDKNNYIAVFNPAHPEVQREIKRKTAELASRYNNVPSFAGISIRIMDWEQHNMTSFGSLDWGYDPYTGKKFAAWLGIPDPGTPQKRYELFCGKYREKWINWRVDVVHELLKEIRDTCRQVNPAVSLYSAVHSTRWAGTQLAREAGIDNFKLDGFRYINAMYSPGRNPGWQKRRICLTDNTLLKLLDASRAHLFAYKYFEAGKGNIPNSALGLRGDDQKWISAHLHPAGMYSMEPYARALAATDADFLGNGGNTYFIDPENNREFLADYLVLPKDNFSLLLNDPRVVVRERNGADYLFYLVNITDQPQKVLLKFSENQPVTRISTGERMMPGQEKQLLLELKPFHLYSWQTRGTRITSVSVYEHN